MRESKFDRYIEEIDKWKISSADKKLVKAFFRDYELGKITGRTSQKETMEHYVLYLKHALEYMNKPVNKITAKNIDKFCKDLMSDKIVSARNNKSPFSEIVKTKIRRTFRQFLEWHNPKKAANLILSLNVKSNIKQKTPEFLTEEEIDKLYRGCKNNEERYLISVLFSSGARASEFHNIRFSDIKLPSKDENYVKLTLRDEFSKTKGRTISLYYKNALEAVSEYLKERREEAKNEEEPVWNKSYLATSKLLNRFGTIKVKKKDGTYKEIGRQLVKRNIHFHLFRSSCATWLANRLNRQELCYYFGWRFSSPVPDHYISRAGMIMKKADESFTQTELGEIKSKLSKHIEDNKLKDETIDRLKTEVDMLKEMREELESIKHSLKNAGQKPNEYFVSTDGEVSRYWKPLTVEK